MKCGDDHRCSNRYFIIIGALLGAVFAGPGCTPQVVRSTPPAAPTSAVEMAEDVARLDKLIESGTMPRRDLVEARDRYQALVDQLNERPARDPALQQLVLARAQATVALYDDLIELSDRPASTRSERADVAQASSARVRAYLEQLLQIQQGVDLSPSLLASPETAVKEPERLEEKTLPPPPARRLLEAYQRGAYDQVIKEVKGAASNGLETLDTGVLVAYALSLGAVGRTSDALTVMDTLEERALIEPMMLEVRYRHVLWLLKEGRRDDASKAIEALRKALDQTGRQLQVLSEPARAIQDDIAHAPPSYLDKSVDVRLAVADGRYGEARDLCSVMLAQEVSRSAIDRVEALFAFVDESESQAFEQALVDLSQLAHARGRAAARDRLAEVAKQFPEARFRPRLESAAMKYGTTLAALTGEEALAASGAEAEPAIEPVPGSRVVSEIEEAEPPVPASRVVSEIEEPEPSGPTSREATVGSAGEVGATPVPTNGPTRVASATAEKTSERSETNSGGLETSSDGAGVEPSAAESALAPAPTPEVMAALHKTLERGIALTTAGRYKEAIAVFDSLAGTQLEAEAKPLRQKAVDRYVQKVREQVARDYVRSSQIRDDAQRLELLTGIYADLKAAIDAYPETTLKAKAEHNLKVIANEIIKLDPGYFDEHESSP